MTSKKLIGNQAFASCMSKSRNEINPAFFEAATQATQTIDCIARRRNVMLNLNKVYVGVVAYKVWYTYDEPDTTNYSMELIT